MSTLATVTTVNLNGIRAASRRGFERWLEVHAPTVLLLQEVRAPQEITADLLGDQWDIISVPCRIKGRAGVAIAVDKTRGSIVSNSIRTVLDNDESDADSGRWVEAEVDYGGTAPFRVVSAYFHSGELGTQKQDAKMAHLPRVGRRMSELLADARAGGAEAIVAGDFNIVRSETDIKNWKPNHNKRSGVLDEEIAFLKQWVDDGWHDITRDLAGSSQGPYTWWSWRGKAFDNNAGWRIDYHYVTPGLASRARDFSIGRAETYDSRFSDHAPLSVIYEM